MLGGWSMKNDGVYNEWKLVVTSTVERIAGSPLRTGCRTIEVRNAKRGQERGTETFLSQP